MLQNIYQFFNKDLSSLGRKILIERELIVLAVQIHSNIECLIKFLFWCLESLLKFF